MKVSGVRPVCSSRIVLRFSRFPDLQESPTRGCVHTHADRHVRGGAKSLLKHFATRCQGAKSCSRFPGFSRIVPQISSGSPGGSSQLDRPNTPTRTYMRGLMYARTRCAKRLFKHFAGFRGCRIQVHAGQLTITAYGSETPGDEDPRQTRAYAHIWRPRSSLVQLQISTRTCGHTYAYVQALKGCGKTFADPTRKGFPPDFSKSFKKFIDK